MIIAMWSGGGRPRHSCTLKSARLFGARRILAKPFNTAALLAAGSGVLSESSPPQRYRGVWVANTFVRPCLSNERT